MFPRHLRVDAQRKCGGIHKVQSSGQPFAFGESRRRSPARSMLIFVHNLQLSEVAAGVTYLHRLGIVHGDLKGVRYYILHRPFASLIVLVG